MSTTDPILFAAEPRFRCAYCGLRVAHEDLPRTLWVEGERLGEKRLYHTSCWLTWRSATPQWPVPPTP
jgi:hypothetical protein